MLGEGPSIDAYETGWPVLEPDLDQATRLAEFTRGACDDGIRAVFALPLHVGAARIGTMTLYRRQPGMLSDDEIANALVLADIATEIVLDLQALRPRRIPPRSARRCPPLRATSPPSHRHGRRPARTTVQTALVRLRAHAFATGRPLSAVTADIVDRQLRFD